MKTNTLDLDGLNLRSGDYICWVSNLFNADRDIVTNETYNDGATYNRSKTGERKFLLNGIIKSRAAVNALRQKLFSSGLKKLTVGTKDMPTFFVMCDLLNFAEDNKIVGKISCQMIAPDPFLYELTPHVITLGATSNSGLTFPFTFPIVFGASTGGQGIVTNIGNAVAYPVIAIVGTCDTFTITNQTTGESMSLAASLASDYDTLIIDNREASRSILINGINRIDLKVGDWLRCAPGDNTFVFTRNSLQIKQHLTIQLQGRWL